MGWYGFAPYVSVAKRKQQAAHTVKKLKKQGHICEPVIIEGRTIANTFWGKAWCKHLESCSDFSNRLPRGRTYVRNGSVIDLKLAEGEITALVRGSSVYQVKIMMDKVMSTTWTHIVHECAGKIASVIELLQGKFSKAVMEIITHPEKGLFPHPKEIKLSCSCPDWADMCKHVAAVLYGVGARLDDKPEELFLLRQADHAELIANVATTSLTKTAADKSDQLLEASDLSSLFGIDIENTLQQDAAPSTRQLKRKKKKSMRQSRSIIQAKPTRKPKTKIIKTAKEKKRSVSGTTKKSNGLPKMKNNLRKHATTKGRSKNRLSKNHRKSGLSF